MSDFLHHWYLQYVHLTSGLMGRGRFTFDRNPFLVRKSYGGRLKNQTIVTIEKGIASLLLRCLRFLNQTNPFFLSHSHFNFLLHFSRWELYQDGSSLKINSYSLFTIGCSVRFIFYLSGRRGGIFPQVSSYAPSRVTPSPMNPLRSTPSGLDREYPLDLLK